MLGDRGEPLVSEATALVERTRLVASGRGAGGGGGGIAAAYIPLQKLAKAATVTSSGSTSDLKGSRVRS